MSPENRDDSLDTNSDSSEQWKNHIVFFCFSFVALFTYLMGADNSWLIFIKSAAVILLLTAILVIAFNFTEKDILDNKTPSIFMPEKEDQVTANGANMEVKFQRPVEELLETAKMHRTLARYYGFGGFSYLQKRHDQMAVEIYRHVLLRNQPINVIKIEYFHKEEAKEFLLDRINYVRKRRKNGALVVINGESSGELKWSLLKTLLVLPFVFLCIETPLKKQQSFLVLFN